MTQPPGPPEGIGTPATDRPDFAPPPDQPGVTPPVPPPGAAWTAPDPGTRVASAPPGARPPTGGATQHRQPGRRVLVASVLAGALLLVGLLSALPLLSSRPAPSTAAPTGAPVVVTVSPSAAPTAASTLTSGGGIGEAASFSGPHGDGTLTVTSATWTDSGEAAPVNGERYLVVDLTVRCTGGEVPVDPILFVAGTGTTTVPAGFGPALTRPLGGRLLAGGDDVSGQLGFALAPGAVQLVLLDEDLHVLATVEIPAP